MLSNDVGSLYPALCELDSKTFAQPQETGVGMISGPDEDPNRVPHQLSRNRPATSVTTLHMLLSLSPPPTALCFPRKFVTLRSRRPRLGIPRCCVESVVSVPGARVVTPRASLLVCTECPPAFWVLRRRKVVPLCGSILEGVRVSAKMSCSPGAPSRQGLSPEAPRKGSRLAA